MSAKHANETSEELRGRTRCVSLDGDSVRGDKEFPWKREGKAKVSMRRHRKELRVQRDALKVPLDPSEAEAALGVKARVSQRRRQEVSRRQTHIPGAACLRYSKTSFVFLPLTSAAGENQGQCQISRALSQRVV